MAEQHFSYLTASASQSVDYHSIDPYQLSLFPATAAAGLAAIHCSGAASTSRNGGSNQVLGPFFCHWEDCPMMNHQFLTGDAIWRHLETVHFNTKMTRNGDALTCQWQGCEEKRPSLFRLKSHMRKHLDWRPFGCQLCDERFKHRGDQKKHLARKHGKSNLHKSSSINKKKTSSKSSSLKQSQRALTPASHLSTSQSTVEDARLSTNYCVSNQTPSPDAPIYSMYTSMTPISLPHDAASTTPPPMFVNPAVISEQQQQHQMTNIDMTGACMSSVMSSPDIKSESTTQNMTNLLKSTPSLENVCGWLQGAAYAQPISHACDDEEDRLSWSSFGPEKTPESTLPSDMVKASPFLTGDLSTSYRYATPPTMADEHLGEIPVSFTSLPPTAFDGFGCYLGVNEQDPSLVNYGQLDLSSSLTTN